MLIFQLILYCLLFTAMVKFAVRGGAVIGHSIFRVLPGTEDIPFVQTWGQVLKKRSILAAIWIAGAAIAAGIAVLFARLI